MNNDITIKIVNKDLYNAVWRSSALDTAFNMGTKDVDKIEGTAIVCDEQDHQGFDLADVLLYLLR